MTDGLFYASILRLMRLGTPYHVAFAMALRCDDAATRPVFTIRPPLLYWMLAHWPGPVPAWVLFTEVWAGLLLAVALLVRPVSARLVLGMLAVLVRELALPAFLVLLVWHWRDRHSRRVALIVCSVIVLYYLWHWSRALAVELPGDPRSVGWVTFGGLSFWLATAGVTPLGLLWPTVGPWLWLLAVGLVLVSSRVPLPVRLTIAVYLLAFAVAGRPGNAYWSWVIWPTQALGMGHTVLRA